MIPYSRPKLSDLYTLSQSKLLENHILHSGTYLYSPYMAVPPPLPPARDLWTSIFGIKQIMLWKVNEQMDDFWVFPQNRAFVKIIDV